MPRPEVGRLRRFLVAAVVLSLALCLVGLAYEGARRWERERAESDFRKRTEAVAEEVRQELGREVELLYSLKSFFQAKREVTREDFRRYCERLLSRYPGLLALSWNVRVADEQRAAFEARVRREGVPGFRVTWPAGDGVTPAGRRPEYVVVLYIEPVARNREAVGLDVSEDPARREALERAWATDRPVATAPIHLVQDPSQPGMLVFLPVASHGGFAVGVFRCQEMLESAVTPRLLEGLQIRLVDEDAGEWTMAVTPAASPRPIRIDGLKRVVPILLAGRRWRLDMASLEPAAGSATWLSWTVLGVGVLLVVLLGALMLVVTGRAAQVEAQVAERTAELSRSNAALQEAKEAAELANRTKDEFLAIVSHELRTPLNGLLGMAEMMTAAACDEEQREGLMVVRRCGEQLVRIINDVLDFSRMEEGRLALNDEEIDLARMMADLVALGRSRALDRSLAVRSVRAEDVPARLLGDGVRLQQVLANLMDNALKFTEKGEIVLGAAVAEREADRVSVRFWVSDSGIGIHAADQGKIFEKFERVDSSLARRYGGTGLGLVISKRLVELMGGSLEVRSAPGEGSTFEFTLPLVVVAGVTQALPK